MRCINNTLKTSLSIKERNIKTLQATMPMFNETFYNKLIK